MKRYFLVNRKTGKMLKSGFMSREDARFQKWARNFQHDIWDSQAEKVIR